MSMHFNASTKIYKLTLEDCKVLKKNGLTKKDMNLTKKGFDKSVTNEIPLYFVMFC